MAEDYLCIELAKLHRHKRAHMPAAEAVRWGESKWKRYTLSHSKRVHLWPKIESFARQTSRTERTCDNWRVRSAFLTRAAGRHEYSYPWQVVVSINKAARLPSVAVSCNTNKPFLYGGSTEISRSGAVHSTCRAVGKWESKSLPVPGLNRCSRL